MSKWWAVSEVEVNLTTKVKNKRIQIRYKSEKIQETNTGDWAIVDCFSLPLQVKL